MHVQGPPITRAGTPTAVDTTTVAELPEAHACGELARLYADIRSTLGVDLVNLIYRHLATLPGALTWAWECLRPHFVSGALHRQADALRSAVRQQVASWEAAFDGVLHHAGAARLTATYNHANSLNLLAMTHLLGLAGTDITGRTARSATRASAAPAAAAEPADAALSGLPSIPAWSDLPAEERERVLRLNCLGESGHPQIVASLYRHLAAWPGLLQQVEPGLVRLEQQGEPASALAFTVHAATRIAADDPLAIAALHPPSIDGDARRRLLRFATVTIPKMVPIGLALQAAFEGGTRTPPPPNPK
jgi:hypothetical protein